MVTALGLVCLALNLGASGTRTEPETTTHETCMNGGKRILWAVPNRLDDMIFELIQHRELLMQCAYRFWIGKRVAPRVSGSVQSLLQGLGEEQCNEGGIPY